MNKSSSPAPALRTPTGISPDETKAIAGSLDTIVADLFAIYVKTKNFHWHMSGPHFRDYHLLLDQQGEQVYAAIDPLAERCRKLGQRTLTSIGAIARQATVKDNDAAMVAPSDMLNELMKDNSALASAMRSAHELCEDAKDIGSAALLETLIDEAERRVWFLFEAGQGEQAVQPRASAA